MPSPVLNKNVCESKIKAKLGTDVMLAQPRICKPQRIVLQLFDLLTIINNN